MGTVHAKEISKITENHIKETRARVDKVHIDGIDRTKDDVLSKAVQSLFQVNNFEEVLKEALTVRKLLEALGVFKNISIFIDTSKGEKASPDGLEVTYRVLEFGRIGAEVYTNIQNNEGSLTGMVAFPNLLGRGEKLQAEYSYGTKKSSNLHAILSKPLMCVGDPRLTAAVFQQGTDYVWNGFRQINRGTLFGVLLKSLPHVEHSICWEGIWRDLKCLSPSTSFLVREEMGHSMKSSIKHVMRADYRDNPIMPNGGTFFRLIQEYAGLGGNVGFHKHEIECQLNQTIIEDVVLQFSLMAGLMRGAGGPNKSFNISDRFFLGGPSSLRGFTLRGAGPHSDENALGAEGSWSGGLHLYMPLPFRPGKGGFGDNLRTHLFLNAGNIGKFEMSDDYYQNMIMLLTNHRLSCGGGILLLFGRARLELNYCMPLKYQFGDRINPGLQFAIGTEFF